LDKQRFIKTFFELIKIPSETPNDKEFVAYLENLFTKMGAKCVKDDFGNMVAKFDAKNSKSTESILFSCHADTVAPGVGIKPVIEDGIIKSSGDTILASDDKAGIAEIIEVLTSIDARPPVEVLITRCEEGGLFGSSKLDLNMIDSKMGFVIDLEDINELVIGGPSKYLFNIDFLGKAAHASEPEHGNSALLGAAKFITDIPHGRIDKETTCNVGVVDSGLVVNTIPNKAHVLAECRSLDHEKAFKLANDIESLANSIAKEKSLKVNIKKELKYKAYKVGEDSKALKLCVKHLKENGAKPEVQVTTGGTDAANIAKKIDVIAIGTGGRNVHQKDEYLIIKEAEIIINSLTDILKSLV
jgi:tripeptide aminopeptidase